jgi:K+ transporter
MRWLIYILLAVEAVLVGCAITRVLAGNAAVLLLAANSILLIWAGKSARNRALRKRNQKPSCCR